MRNKKSHLTMAVVLVAATMLIAGGVAVASNTGFKINKPLAIAGGGSIGNNWTSIPYFHPYTNGAGLCTSWASCRPASRAPRSSRSTRRPG
jgi:hypothetical protein